jgi:hypothetical protein
MGRLQGEIKALVESYTEWFYSVYVMAGEPIEQSPWLSWPIIRNLYFQDRGLAFDTNSRRYVHASLERSLKRALKTLVDRGEICRVRFPWGWHYTTPETSGNMRLVNRIADSATSGGLRHNPKDEISRMAGKRRVPKVPATSGKRTSGLL